MKRGDEAGVFSAARLSGTESEAGDLTLGDRYINNTGPNFNT